MSKGEETMRVFLDISRQMILLIDEEGRMENEYTMAQVIEAMKRLQKEQKEKQPKIVIPKEEIPKEWEERYKLYEELKKKGMKLKNNPLTHDEIMFNKLYRKIKYHEKKQKEEKGKESPKSNSE